MRRLTIIKKSKIVNAIPALCAAGNPFLGLLQSIQSIACSPSQISPEAER